MPAFKLPDVQLETLAGFIRSLNVTAFEMKPEGDAAAGEQFFFGAANCSGCHMVRGRGSSKAPDLSSVATRLSLAELDRSVVDPSSRLVEGYSVVNLRLQDGRQLRGFARNEGKHDLQLETFDGQLHYLLEGEYTVTSPRRPHSCPR